MFSIISTILTNDIVLLLNFIWFLKPKFRDLKEKWPEISEKIQKKYSFYKHAAGISDFLMWMYNVCLRKIKGNNIEEWSRFVQLCEYPESCCMTQYIYEKNKQKNELKGAS